MKAIPRLDFALLLFLIVLPNVLGSIPSATSRPDQPASHIPPVASSSDPLQNVKIPCYGDQLSRIRFAGAKDLGSACHTPKDRFDHIYPFRIVDWHTKRSLLKVI
jgi:hypothetical protein